MSEIKQNITNELSEEELENVAGGFGRPTMDDPRYREQIIAAPVAMAEKT